MSNTVNVIPSGIVINPWCPWLAASPDRKVYNPNRDSPFGLLEIKCPVVESVSEVDYLQKIDDQRYQLKENHNYFYQILMQLAVTGLEWCDLFVWCENDSASITIYFDANKWNSVQEKLDIFYFQYFL